MAKIKVNFNEDGSAYVDTSQLEAQVGTTIAQKEQNLLNYLNEKDQVKAVQAGEAQYNQKIQGLITKSERHQEAAKVRAEALGVLNDAVVQYSLENGIERELTPIEAVRVLSQTGAFDEFKEQYPGINPALVLDSLRDPYFLEESLNQIVETLPDPQADTPTGIINNNSASDLLEMSDDDIDKLLNQLAEDEKTDGINW